MYKDKLTYSRQLDQEELSSMDKTLKREINLARNIQSQLLNGKTPVFQGGKVSGASIPARLIGGDYYDFYPLVNGKLRIVIGDVMGKGIPAAMLMILTRGAFRSAAETTKSPAETLMSMNQALYSDLRILKSFVTLLCADWDPASSVLTYANAGHHLPLFIQAKQEKVEEVPKVKGIMIGGLPNQQYTNKSIQLSNQDTVFFYTDGIIEALNEDKEQYRLERLIQTLLLHKEKGVEEIQTSVLASVEAFTNGLAQRDDITMVVLKINDQQVEITSLNSPLMK
ncbi:PP2C family protein-serine/threonine phosphatase [Domibacillus enclensis]|uniref:Serine/threonine protein phosphatase n=1 Tax=Domibacillus enclensis TaxID=1017273 RepID=A0A1N7AAX8_9BACI|nr:PP2C family protein-serine/threonine phosphatase [Domibacillus enclensis]OXS75756.1 serine/threonine protein phosphatase [Domibacillus enclensis]SIR36123.1 sigma-B regulation protein RsbU (phosphoserine phosphatase) [Domibacillus enclensis]